MSSPKWLDGWADRTAYDKLYWSGVKEKAEDLCSDGCSGVPDWMIWTCWEHDYHYRTHESVEGWPIKKCEADYIFRRRIQQSSGFGRFSPVSWWRWLGVRFLATKAWNQGGIYNGGRN